MFEQVCTLGVDIHTHTHTHTHLHRDTHSHIPSQRHPLTHTPHTYTTHTPRNVVHHHEPTYLFKSSLYCEIVKFEENCPGQKLGKMDQKWPKYGVSGHFPTNH